jgi:hypothetical protein
MEARRSITLYASKVAAFAGMHAYCDRRQALLDQWFFSDRKGCCDAIAKYAPDRAKELELTEDEVQQFKQAYASAMAAPNSVLLAEAVQSVPEGRVRDAVRSESSRNRGNRDEDAALNQVEKEMGTAITGRNACLFRRNVYSDPTLEIGVIGRVDGWRKEANEIVEVKNRMNRFFDKIPLYEKVQLQVYMWMTGAATCRWVQRLHGQVKQQTVEADMPYLDRVVWREVISSVKDDLLPLLNGDEECQQALLESGLLPEKYCNQIK